MMSKKIYRSRRERVLGGVCGGLAEYFDLDVLLIRLFFILLFFVHGVSLLFYIIAWAVIPEKPYHITSNKVKKEEKTKPGDYPGEEDNIDSPAPAGDYEKSTDISAATYDGEALEDREKDRVDDQGQKRRTIGIILVALGSIFLLDNWFPFFYWGSFWPLALIAVGLGIVWQATRE